MLTLIALLLFAVCRWEYVCDAAGNCQNVPLCDRVTDPVPLVRPSLAPIVPPSIAPITPPVLPPLGTTHCENVQVWDAVGGVRWTTVCH